MIIKLWHTANTLLDRIASYLPDPLLLGIRLYWGWQFFLSGKGKLGNLEGTTEFFAELGLPFAKLNAVMAGSTECFGGLLLLAGLFSRVVSVPLIGTMVVAYLTAHLDVVKTLWSDSDAFVTAAPFLFMFASVIVFTFGPGKFSVDEMLRRRGSAKA
jgi:putative oxidoreductase